MDWGFWREILDVRQLPDEVQWAVIAAAVGLLILAIMAVRRELAWRRRGREMRHAAIAAGLFYRGEVLPFSRRDPVWKLRLLSFGRGHRVGHVTEGKLDFLDVWLFDSQYVTPRGKRLRQTVAAFRIAGADMPQFFLTQESEVSKREEKAGFRDIDFDSHPLFSEQCGASSRPGD